MGTTTSLADFDGVCHQIQLSGITILVILNCCRKELQSLNIGIHLLRGFQGNRLFLGHINGIFLLDDILCERSQRVSIPVEFNSVLFQGLRVHRRVYLENLRQQLLSVDVLIRLRHWNLRECKRLSAEQASCRHQKTDALDCESFIFHANSSIAITALR